MLISKISTQKMIDNGKHKALVVASLIVLICTMGSYYFINSALHLLFFEVGLRLPFNL